MATNSGQLVQALIDGGVQPAAARVIANALANADTPQFSQSRDLSDQTPAASLRMIDRDTRKYQFTNLDFSAEEPFQRRLRTNPGQYLSSASDHPYKDAQPVAPVPPLSKASITGGAYVSVDNTVQDGAPLATVNLKLSARPGTHLRINPATNSVEAVPLAFGSPQGLVTADVTERNDATAVELAVRGLKPITVLQADGTSRGLLGWLNGTVPSATIFTPWVQQNLLNKSTGADVLAALGAAAYSTGSWTPGFAMIGTGSLSPTVTYNASFNVGRWARIGDLVHVTGRVALSAMTSAGNGILAVSGLPFTVLAGQPGHAAGVVGYKTGWITQGPECLYTEPAGTNLVLAYHTPTTIALLTQANLSATADMIFSCTYRAAT